MMDRLTNDAPHRFLCDAMLGSLCRWLRFAGFDCEYSGVKASDHSIQERAESDGRWLLTMDRAMASRGPRSLLLHERDLDGQLFEVFRRLRLLPNPSLHHARCGHCNAILEPVDKSELPRIVPPHVLTTAQRFRRCRGCQQIYWPGSHTERISHRLAAVRDRLMKIESDHHQ